MSTGNGCYGLKLDMPSGPDRDAIVFVNKDASGWKVTRATSTRK